MPRKSEGVERWMDSSLEIRDLKFARGSFPGTPIYYTDQEHGYIRVIDWKLDKITVDGKTIEVVMLIGKTADGVRV